jgi:hypothetical protein
MTYDGIRCIGEEELQLQLFFSTALDGARDQIREPAALHPEKGLSSHWIGGWIDAIVSLELVEKTENSGPCRESKHNSSAVQPRA